MKAPNTIRSKVRNTLTQTSLRYLLASDEVHTSDSGSSATSSAVTAIWAMVVECIAGQPIAEAFSSLLMSLWTFFTFSVSLETAPFGKRIIRLPSGSIR